MSFIGRGADLLALRERVQTAPLVTILGPPGIGKTRLAERYLELHGGRATFACDLTEATGVDGISAALAHALNVPLRAGESAGAVDQLGDAMDARGPILVLLDNF